MALQRFWIVSRTDVNVAILEHFSDMPFNTQDFSYVTLVSHEHRQNDWNLFKNLSFNLMTSRLQQSSDRAFPANSLEFVMPIFAGVEGGFDLDEKRYEFEEHNQIVVLPDWTEIPLTDPAIPAEVQQSNMSNRCVTHHHVHF